MWVLRPAALPLALALLAGCTTPAADVGSDAASAPLELPFGLRGCQAALVVVAVPQSALAARLPEGFRSLSLQEIAATSAPNPAEDANFGVEMFVCEEADGMEGVVAPAVYGSFFTLVEVPEEHRRDVTLHAVKWDTIVADPAARAALRERGLPTWGANASFSEFAAVGGAVAFRGAIGFDGGFGLSFEGRGALPYEPTGSFVEYTEVPAGLAAWSAQYTWDVLAVGAASVRASGESFATEVLGTGARQGAVFAGVVDFHHGNVTVPG